MTSSYALSFREAAQQPEVAGEKAVSLGRLAAAGFRVPGGFVLSSSVYEEFIGASGIRRLLHPLAHSRDDPFSDSMAFEWDRIRLLCLRSPLTESIRSILIAALTQSGVFGAPLAVRSSAIGAEASAEPPAGAHRTLLNVMGIEPLEMALRSCWASLWTPRAVASRRRSGAAHAEGAMAVIVQRLVPADAAGVVSTRSPAAGADEIVVQASWGLGDGVTSGRVDPDTYVVRPQQGRLALAHMTTGQKQCVAVPAATGDVVWRDTSPEQRQRMAITPDQALAIAETAHRIEQVLGEPQEIEWARVGSNVFLLQARRLAARPAIREVVTPIAGRAGGSAASATDAIPELLRSHPAAHPWGEDRWTAAAPGEALPLVPSPFSWSLLHLKVEEGFRRLFESIGYELPHGTEIVRRMHGRTYTNSAALQWLYRDALGIAPEVTNRVLGGPPPAVAPRRSGRGRAARRLHLVRASLAAGDAVGTAHRWLRLLHHEADLLAAQDLVRKSDLDLLDLLVRNTDLMARVYPRCLWVSAWCGGAFLALEELLAPRFGEEAAPLASAIVAGAGGLPGAEQGYLLQQVAAAAASEPGAAAFLERLLALSAAEAAAPAREWRAALAGTRAGILFAEFLKRYGYRAAGETEAMQPRWNEEPAFPLSVAAGILAYGVPERQDPRARAAQARARAETRLGVWGRLRLRRLLSAAGRGVRACENVKLAMAHHAAFHRRFALEVGTRMARRGLIELPEDAFFLHAEEIRPFLLGETLDGDTRALVAGRRRQLSEDRSGPAPAALNAGGTQEAGAPAGQAQREEGSRQHFEGLPASAGEAEGPARVLRDASDGRRLQAGDILIAPATDPAWTPLFLRAGAVVVESGGILSHAAIGAREYGVPAIVSAAGICSVPDGARVKVDGSRGEVVLLP